MTTKARYYNNILEYYDSVTHERVAPFAPIVFEDDFLGATTIISDLSTSPWTAIDVSAAGDTTPLIAADVANGILRLPLTSNAEAQRSGVAFGDQRPFVLNQGLVFEARIALSVLPTLVSEAVFGLAGDDNAVADTVAESIWFKADGDGVIVVESDDTSNTNDDVATGITLTAGLFAIFRIDATIITDVKFYINGANVAAGTTFNMSQVAALALQPYISINKASGAGLGIVDVDYVRVWQTRS